MSDSWVDFYDEAEHLGNRFGVKGPHYGPDGHRGVDWNRHPEGTPIPSWTAGTVALVDLYKTLGNTLVVDRGDGTWAGFAHMQARSKLRIGEKIEPGSIVGLVGDTGTASDGAHLHATLEPRITIGTPRAMDPLPHIRAAIQQYQLAGASASTSAEEFDMVQIIKRVDPNQADEWSVHSLLFTGPTPIERGFYIVEDADEIKRLELLHQTNAREESRAWYIALQQTSTRQHDMVLRTLASAGGGGANLRPVLEAVAKTPTAVADLLAERLRA